MKKLTVCFFLFLAILHGFAAPVQAQNNGKLNIFTSILPQKFFVERLAGDLAEVEVLVGPGMSPHTYEPLPQQMGRLARASIFFTIGVPFEKALEKRLKSACPDLQIIPTDTGVRRRMMENFSDNHQHSESCTHGEGESDPHIWLDPDQVIIQAGNIAQALKQALPQHQTVIDSRLASFTTELQALNSELAKTLKPFQGQTMLVFHPAFGYFCERFGLKQQPIEIEGKEPGPRQLGELIRKCLAEKIHVIFVQKQFPVAAANTIAGSISGAVVQIDPLAENYFSSLREIARAITSALQKK